MLAPLLSVLNVVKDGNDLPGGCQAVLACWKVSSGVE